MKTSASKSALISLMLSVITALTIFLSWEAGKAYVYLIQTYVSPTYFDFAWWQFGALLSVAITAGFLADKISIKRLVPYFLGFFAVWLIASVVAAKFWGLNLLFLKTLITTSLVICVIHLKKLWAIDSELTE